MTCYHWDAPQRVVALMAEHRLLSLDCIGLWTLVKRCEVEEALVQVDADLEAGDPNAPLSLCPACAEEYTRDMEAQWAEYHAGLL
jgi:hypothetical protein